MRYINAQDIFPNDVLAVMQQFIDGAYIYVPKKPDNRKKWGENTRSKIETQERNEKIYAKYKCGIGVNELAAEYFLSDKSIQRIITQGKKQEQQNE
jgi:Mor family transcriptional regulator